MSLIVLVILSAIALLLGGHPSVIVMMIRISVLVISMNSG